jgi:hypothetical protein
MEPVRSEAEALEMIMEPYSERSMLQYYDFAAIPKFLEVRSRIERSHYVYEVDLLLEVYSADRSVVTKIRGYGESRTGFHAGRTIQDGARLALRSAVEAVRDGIDQRKNLFMH